MNRSTKIWHWLGRRPYVLSYFLLLVVVFSLGIVQRSNTDRRFQDQHDTADKICAVQSDNRNVLRQVIVIATEQRGIRLNLTGIPEFQALDPATKAYLTSVQNQGATTPSSTPPPPNPLRDKMLEQVPQIDCSLITSVK